MRLIASLLAILSPALAHADEAGNALVSSLIGNAPVLIAVIAVFLRLGHRAGAQEEAFRQVRADISEVKAEVKSAIGNMVSKATLAAHEADNAAAHAKFETKEQLVLRLSAMESKVERDVERELHRRHGG